MLIKVRVDQVHGNRISNLINKHPCQEYLVYEQAFLQCLGLYGTLHRIGDFLPGYTAHIFINNNTPPKEKLASTLVPC